MNRSSFTVIRGGLSDNAATSRKEFVSAYVTDTRLMGVVAMYIHFRLPDNEVMGDLHQFFYFDAEEYGFETYKSILGDDPEALRETEVSLIGGLGGRKIPVTLREAQYLLQEYVRLNRSAHLPMPEGAGEYDFLLKPEIRLAEPEKYILMEKQCVRPETPCEVINYFLMRCFGRDFSAAAFLAEPGLNMDLFPEYSMGTFCKNSIEAGDEPDTYISESLVEISDRYYITITCIRVKDMRVTSYERLSSFKVSPAEAAMMLSRSEFVSVYEMLDKPEAFTSSSTKRTPGAMVTPYDTGTLYMMFQPSNRHVAQWEYRLNEDVYGMYFVSEGGQLISAAYSLDAIRALEHDLANSSFRRKLIPISRYEFQEPVLFEFIQSGFDDFESFVDAIRTGEE
ncbi:MAG: hypothetical protein ACI4LA_09090 [Emergencia sp.]